MPTTMAVRFCLLLQFLMPTMLLDRLLQLRDQLLHQAALPVAALHLDTLLDQLLAPSTRSGPRAA